MYSILAEFHDVQVQLRGKRAEALHLLNERHGVEQCHGSRGESYFKERKHFCVGNTSETPACK